MFLPPPPPLHQALGSRRALAERLEDRGGIAPVLWPLCVLGVVLSLSGALAFAASVWGRAVSDWHQHPPRSVRTVAYPFASCCIRWRMGYEFLTNTSVGVFQYVFLRLACTIITLVAEFFDVSA